MPDSIVTCTHRAAQRVGLVVKVSIAAWAVVLAGALGSSPQCIVAPYIDRDAVALRVLLAALAAPALAQLWAPPWLLLDFSDIELPRKIAGGVAMMAPAFILLAIALMPCVGQSYDSTRRAGCESAVAVGPLGIFELCAILANFEGSAMVAGGVLTFLCFCIGTFVLAPVAALVMAATAPLVLLQRRMLEKKRLATLSGLESVVHSGEGMPSACCICLDSFERGDACNRLPCNAGHIFHVECLQYWLQRSNLCPLCRFNIFEALSSDQGQRPPVHEPQYGFDNSIIYTL